MVIEPFRANALIHEVDVSVDIHKANVEQKGPVTALGGASVQDIPVTHKEAAEIDYLKPDPFTWMDEDDDDFVTPIVFQNKKVSHYLPYCLIGL